MTYGALKMLMLFADSWDLALPYKPPVVPVLDKELVPFGWTMYSV